MGFRDQLMLAPEVTHGTYAAPTRSYEVDSAEPSYEPNVYQGSGLLGAGYFTDRSARRKVVTRKAVHAHAQDVRTTGMGLQVDQLFASGPTPLQQGGTAAYQQTHVLALPGANHGATIQVGMSRTESSTVDAYTYLGARMLEMTLTQDSKADAPLKMETSWDCQNVTDAQSLASFTAPTGGTFALGEFGYKMHNTPGSEAAVAGIRGCSIKIARPQDVERYCANMAGLRRVPVLNDRKEVVTGTITADHMDKANFNDRFLADTKFSQIFEWVGPLIASTFYFTFRVTLPACYLLGPLPKLDGPSVVSGEYGWAALDDDTNEPITVTIISTDTAI